MSLTDDISLLQQIPVFADFADDHLRLLAFSAESLDYRSGSTLFDEGERADGGLVVAEGAVSLLKRGPDGFDEVDKATVGTLLGETALLVDTKRPCRAVAVGGVRVIRIRRALFKRMVQEYPELAQRLFNKQAQRFQTTVSALRPIGERIAELQRIAGDKLD
ncbi:Crp/Fnr family transcriptional regulator [Roseibium limicola]|uniref:Crp/Fnr family transcriptional regulator n=1 Tax=Roseibium limicola TaxID=2816037 RepID=A0A939EQH3_9HYPH|nr:Crp/Fnr family transcriptional regulator [Roseibium limicola]MBO0346722.1 Crp/Fnr family transcriptional regulator [Roseibium limicola]